MMGRDSSKTILMLSLWDWERGIKSCENPLSFPCPMNPGITYLTLQAYELRLEGGKHCSGRWKGNWASLGRIPKQNWLGPKKISVLTVLFQDIQREFINLPPVSLLGYCYCVLWVVNHTTFPQKRNQIKHLLYARYPCRCHRPIIYFWKKIYQ